MPGLPDLSRDLARQYRITQADALEVIQFINQDIVERLSREQDLHIDRFGSFSNINGVIRFNPSKFMKEYVKNKKLNIDLDTGED